MKNNNVTEEKKVNTERFGDSEHDTRIHKNLKPHKGNPEYDPKYKTYRN